MDDPLKNPGGPGSPPDQGKVVDPAMAAQMESMLGILRDAARFSELSEQHLKSMAEHAKDVTKNFNKEKLSSVVDLFDDVENKLAEINRFTKKFVHEVRNIKDTKEAKEQIEDMVKAMKDALTSQKSFSAGAGAIRRQIGDWEKALGRFGGEVRDLTTGEMKDLTNLAERTSKAGKDFSSSIKRSELGKFGDFVRGGVGATKPGYVPELKERWGAMKEAFQAPRMARMAAGGVEGAEGAAGIAGVMGGVVDAIEGGVTALEIGMEALGGPLGWLVIAVEALIAVFDKYVKQNKDMESKLAKGGLFTGNAMLDQYGGTTIGGEDAFQRTRRALTPRGTGLNELGITWERNLDIAGALAGGGYGIKGMFGDERLADARGTTTGIQGLTSGFAGGGFGQVQRMVTGVGRVLGMSDAEGVGEILKMLEQYSQTLDSTEKFLAQIDKDTDAAGISTTKYLKIIDDVSSHFNKMNKEITQTLSIMRELGRSGAVSSEVLKDMMEFLTTENKPDVGGIAEDIYAQTQMSKKDRDAVSAAADAGVKAQLDTIRGQVSDMDKAAGGAGVGINVPTISLGRGGAADFAKATTAIDKLEVDTKTALANGKISKPQAAMIDQSIQSLREGVTAAGNSRADAYGRSAGRAAGVITPAGTAALNLTKMQSAAGQWKINMSDLVTGQNLAAGGDSTAAIGFLKQLSEIYHMDPAESRRRFSETMTERTTSLMAGGDDQAKMDAQALTKEVFQKWKAKKILPDWAKERGYTLDGLDKINSSVEDNAKFLKDNPEMAKEFYQLTSLGSQIVQHAADQYDVTNTQLALELDKARKVGRQTQSMADMFGAVFSKWFTKIISWLEYIGNAIGWIVSKASAGLFGSFESQQKDRDKTFNKMKDQMSTDIGEIPTKLEEVQRAQLQLEQKNKGVGMDQWSKADQEQYKKLDEIGDHLEHVRNILTPETEQGHFGSQDEVDDSTKSLKEFADALNELRGVTTATTAAVSGTNAVAGAGQSSVDSHNKTTYNVGTVKQIYGVQDSAATANENPSPAWVPGP